MDFLKEIWATISKNRSRSLLTGFGVFWGMLMLMILVGLGNALQTGIFSSINGFNVNSCILGTSATAKPYKGLPRYRTWSIQNNDLNILMQEVEGIDALAPFVMGEKTDNNVGHGERSGSYSILGVVPEFTRLLFTEMLYGRFINEIDIQEKRKVCVIGEKVYQVVFPEGGDPTGQYLRVGNIHYRIIGVRKKCNTDIYLGGHPDEQVNLPFTTAQQAYHYGENIHMMMASAQPGVPMQGVIDGISATLKQLHSIDPTDTKAIWSQNFEEQLKAFQYLKLGISALVWLIGLGTLISGAVGVSNIMLVTVRERTKEIGIRRAIGASPFSIARQIISESTVLTAFAGILGIMAGVGILQLISPILAASDTFIKDPQVSFGVAVSALAVIIVIGIVAGLLPAMRALAIKPIEALGEE